MTIIRSRSTSTDLFSLTLPHHQPDQHVPGSMRRSFFQVHDAFRPPEVKKYDATILVVVSGSRGQQIVFVYPPKPPKPPPARLERVTSPKHTSPEMSTSPTPSPTEPRRPFGNKVDWDSCDTCFELNAAGLSSLLCPTKQTLCNKLNKISIDNLMFLSRPMFLFKDKTKKSMDTDLTHYSIALALPVSRTSPRKVKAYSHLLALFTKACEREQQRCGFLTRELTCLQKIRDASPNWRALEVTARKHCELARELVTVADAIIHGDPLQVRVNGWIEIGLNMPSHHKEKEIPAGRLFRALPYDACIKAKDLPKLKFPIDGQDKIQKVSQLISPLVNLQEISMSQDISIGLVCSIAHHMVNWELIRPIPRLANNSVLVVDSQAPFPPSNQHQEDFKKLFPNLPPLIIVLERFSVPQTLKQHMSELPKDSQENFARAVVWLLRYNYVRQLKTYIYLNIPHNYYSSSIDVGHMTSSVIHMKSKLTNYETEYISGLSKDYQLNKTFKSLVRYFNGEFSDQEICWRENLSHETMQRILKTFKRVLLTYQL